MNLLITGREADPEIVAALRDEGVAVDLAD